MSCFGALTFCFLIAIKFVSPCLTGHLFCNCLLTEFLAAALIVTQLSAIICVAGMFLFSFFRPGKIHKLMRAVPLKPLFYQVLPRR